MKKLATIIFVLFFASLTNAQITITLNDVEDQIYVGQTFVDYVDTLMRQVDIGNPGTTANEWDFTFLNADEAVYAYEQTVMEPEGTEFAESFPGAEYALYVNDATEYGQGELYWYMGSDGNSALSYGFGLKGTTDLGSGTALIVSEPAEVGGVYPMTLGTKWTYEGTETRTYKVGAFPFIVTADIDVTYEIDAFGTLVLPGNKRYDALRLKEHRITIIHYPFSPDDRVEETVFTFLTKTGEEVSVSLISPEENDFGYVYVDGIMWNDGKITAVDDEENVMIDFTLKQNYPNPFNPSTVIEYSVPENSYVELKVYDIIGNEITTLVSEEKSRGYYQIQFNAKGLASGTYIYSLKTNKSVQTKKMILMK
jgi:hypothetical protein